MKLKEIVLSAVCTIGVSACNHYDVASSGKDATGIPTLDPIVPTLGQDDIVHFDRPPIYTHPEDPEFSDDSYAYYCIRKENHKNYVVLVKVDAKVSSDYGIDEVVIAIPKNNGTMQYRHAREWRCEPGELSTEVTYQMGEKNQGAQELPLEVMATDCEGNATGLEFVEDCDKFERHHCR